MDDLVSAHPELDEKALRRGYAQVKSIQGKAGKTKPVGKKKASKKASKKAGKKVSKRITAEANAIARELAPGIIDFPESSLMRLAEAKTSREIRSFILQHGTKAIKAALAELES